jgi:phospholipid/cholesterol/gamma-HCH transport system substrate-binding protein
MDLHYKQEVSVGALVIVAAAILVAGLMWLTNRSFGTSGTAEVPVRFEDVAGLRVGDPVQVSGFKVGTVTNVVLEDVGRVTVYMQVGNAWKPHTDAKAFVAALDFFGAKFVRYVPGHAPQLLNPGQTLTGTHEAGLTDAASGLSDQAASVLTGIQGIASQQTANDIHATMLAVQRALNVMSKLGEGPTVADATAALKTFQQLAARLDSTLANPAVGRTMGQMDSIATNLNTVTRQLATTSSAINSLLIKVDSSKGTIGKMMNDTTVYNDLHELSRSLKALLDDMRERPGRYFNLKVF